MRKCDVCGLDEAAENTACPQHRMWRAEADVERLLALALRDADGMIVTQGAFNALIGQRDRFRKRVAELEHPEFRRHAIDAIKAAEWQRNEAKRRVAELEGEVERLQTVLDAAIDELKAIDVLRLRRRERTMQHVCGLSGYDPMRDPSCPACGEAKGGG